MIDKNDFVFAPPSYVRSLYTIQADPEPLKPTSQPKPKPRPKSRSVPRLSAQEVQRANDAYYERERLLEASRRQRRSIYEYESDGHSCFYDFTIKCMVKRFNEINARLEPYFVADTHARVDADMRYQRELEERVKK